MSNLPENWKVKTILQLGGGSKETVQTGPFGAQLHAEDYVEEGIPLILIKNISDSGLNESGIPKITEEDAQRLNRYSVKAGDMVFSRVGRVGSCFLVTEKEYGWIISGQMLRIRLPRASIDFNYLYYALRDEKAQDAINGSSVGTTRTSINTEILEKLSINVPPLEQQQKIANILSTVDKLIEKTQTLIDKYTAIKQGMMADLFTRGIDLSPGPDGTHASNPNYGQLRPSFDAAPELYQQTDLGCVPKEWEVGKLGNYSSICRGASPRPITDPKYFGDTNVGWVRISDVTKSGFYLETTTQYLSPLGESRSVRVFPGDLVMSICATVGKPVILNMDACIHDGFVLFSDYEHIFDKKFLLYWLSENENTFINMGQPGTQVNLNTNLVGSLKTILPSKEEQSSIRERIDCLLQELEVHKKYLDKLKKQKKGLMQDLLTGKVKV